jgi:antitoxin component YwqK of YwqJK toxin-antitoxin module
MDDVPAGLNAWLFTHIVLPGCAIFFIYYQYAIWSVKKEEKKKEKKEKEEKEEEERKAWAIEDSRLIKLKGVYELSDTIKVNGKTYLNVNWVKTLHKDYKELNNKNVPFLSKQYKSLDYDKKLIIRAIDKYLLNGIVNIRNDKGDFINKDTYEAGEKKFSIYYDKSIKLKEGCWTSKFDNGQLRTECHYKNGILQGTYKRWYANGQLEFEAYYRNGLWHGSIKMWHENGQLKYKWKYLNGLKDD